MRKIDQDKTRLVTTVRFTPFELALLDQCKAKRGIKSRTQYLVVLITEDSKST